MDVENFKLIGFHGFWMGASLLIFRLLVVMKSAVNLTHSASSVDTNSLGCLSLLVIKMTHRVLHYVTHLLSGPILFL